MEKEKIVNIIDDVSNKSNKDLFLTLEQLSNEFENTKQLIIDLTRHLESIEDSYNKVNKEIEKRTTT
jgi:predicted transcriptional regulator